MGSSVATTGLSAVRTDAAALSAPVRVGLTAVSALAYAAGFPPLAWPLAPWLALAPLLVACASVRPAQAALLGLLWATVAAAAVAWFLPGMLSGYFGLGLVGSWLATVTVVGGLHGVYIGAFAAWVAWLARRGAANPLLLAGGWMVVELIRSQSGVSSPWALAAYSQIAWTPVIQIADLAGPYGIGLLIAAVNALLAAALLPSLRGRRPRVTAAIVGAALLVTGVYGQWRLARPFADGAPVPVVVVQGGAPPRSAGERAERLARYVALSAEAGPSAGGLIVWPEHAVADYLEEDTPSRAAALRLSREASADLVLGGPHFAPAPAGTRYHNSAWLVRDGRLAGRYDKRRLVPVAESAYTAGTGSSLLPGAALRLGALVCFEAMFTDLARRAVDEGAEVLVNLSNDGWFGHPEPARHQLDIATLRAVETRRYLVRAASTGISAVIDPHGRTLVESAFGRREALRTSVRASHVITPYQRWGDLPAWLAVAGVVFATSRTWLGARASRPQRGSGALRERAPELALAHQRLPASGETPALPGTNNRRYP